MCQVVHSPVAMVVVEFVAIMVMVGGERNGRMGSS
jgi:hypothetical protein